MCDPRNANIMVDIVAELVTGGKAFTAFDATQAGMQRGTTERHRYLKGQVHRNMQTELSTGRYERTLINTPSGRDAWLYHPVGFDVQSYTNTMNGVQADQDADDDDADGNPSYLQHADNEGRLLINRSFTQSLGLWPGKMVEVGALGGKLTLAASLGSGIADKFYSVNADGRVRIGPDVIGQHLFMTIYEIKTRKGFIITFDPKTQRVTISL